MGVTFDFYFHFAFHNFSRIEIMKLINIRALLSPPSLSLPPMLSICPSLCLFACSVCQSIYISRNPFLSLSDFYLSFSLALLLFRSLSAPISVHIPLTSPSTRPPMYLFPRLSVSISLPVMQRLLYVGHVYRWTEIRVQMDMERFEFDFNWNVRER